MATQDVDVSIEALKRPAATLQVEAAEEDYVPEPLSKKRKVEQSFIDVEITPLKDQASMSDREVQVQNTDHDQVQEGEGEAIKNQELREIEEGKSWEKGFEGDVMEEKGAKFEEEDEEQMQEEIIEQQTASDEQKSKAELKMEKVTEKESKKKQKVAQKEAREKERAAKKEAEKAQYARRRWCERYTNDLRKKFPKNEVPALEVLFHMADLPTPPNVTGMKEGNKILEYCHWVMDDISNMFFEEKCEMHQALASVASARLQLIWSLHTQKTFGHTIDNGWRPYPPTKQPGIVVQEQHTQKQHAQGQPGTEPGPEEEQSKEQ